MYLSSLKLKRIIKKNIYTKFPKDICIFQYVNCNLAHICRKFILLNLSLFALFVFYKSILQVKAHKIYRKQNQNREARFNCVVKLMFIPFALRMAKRKIHLAVWLI